MMTEETSGKEILSILDIKALLPHRYPMLLVDKIIDLVPGESATGIKCVSCNEPFFNGHFPASPVMPGVLIVEAMAQTAGVVAMTQAKPGIPNKTAVYFMAIENAKFRKPVFPGDVLEMKVEKIRHKGNVWKFSGKGYVEGILHAEAVFMAMLTDVK